MKNLEIVKHVDSKGEVDEYLVLEEYPEIEYTLLKRDTTFQPFIAAWEYDKENVCWQNGHYFQRLEDAVSYIKQLLYNHQLAELAEREYKDLTPFEREYEERMDVLSELLRNNYSDALYDAVADYQMNHMKRVLEKYEEDIDSKEKRDCYNILETAVHYSTNGSVNYYVNTKEEADKIEVIVWGEIGQYMLDAPEVYQDRDGDWCISCMFGGRYVPNWDGWKED